MTVCLSNAREHLALDPASSQLQRLKEVYLKRWRTAGIDSKLEETYALAQRLRPAHGVLQWSRGLIHPLWPAFCALSTPSLRQVDREGKHDGRAAFPGNVEQRREIT